MNRRKFLRNGSIAGMAVASITVGSCTPGTLNKNAEEKSTDTSTDDFTLHEATIDQLQGYMRDGKHTARSIAELYLKRIADIDKKGPHINSIIELNPDALSIADEMDKERKEGKIRGPLHGIPVLVKDNINTADKMMTTAGSIALNGNIASKDAFIVGRLRQAGAVLLGKTNLSEWANIRSSRSASGWSSRGGQTKNPYFLDRSPSGSSSGSGAAIAANLCSLAIGTETNGSIIAPASHNGIVGLKPTVGLVSRQGIIPISKTQDTAGPMTRTVRDTAILLGALTGIDQHDTVTLESVGKIQEDYASTLDAESLKGIRIGIESTFLKGHESVVRLYQEAIQTFKDKGAEIVEVELLKATRENGRSESLVLEYEFKDGLNQYLAGANGKVKTLAELIDFNKKNESVAMPFFKQEIFEISNSRGGLDNKEYLDALRGVLGCRKIINDLMAAEKLDVICGTSMGPACAIDLINGDYDTGFYFCSAAAMAGYPHITVPMGNINGLPVGLSFILTAYRERELLSYAYAYEQASNKRQPPKFIPTTVPA